MLAARRLVDRDPVRYATGRLFRDLGVAMVTANPYWKVIISGDLPENPRKPYVIVSNHQSSADIPFLSHLPWEMKWMAKKELFRVPFAGWMLRLAGDIPVDRRNPRSAAAALRRARWYVEHGCSVMVFPEGTRSPDGKVHGFAKGAFRLAIDAGVDVLPVAIDGSFDCLPKQTWKFSPVDAVKIKVLPAIETSHLDRSAVEDLSRRTRDVIIDQVGEWRGLDSSEISADG